MRSRRLLFRTLIWGPLAGRPWQAVGMAAAIALGVAMVAAIHWVNASALHSFEKGVSALSGRANLSVQPTGGGLDEGLLPRIRNFPEVAAAYPALKMRLPVAGGGRLPLLGVDMLRDAAVRGDYLPELGGQGPSFRDLLDKGAILLGRDAARRLEVGVGDTLQVQRGADTVGLRIAGLLPTEAFWSRGAVMDLATAQWTLDRLGELDRIDVVLTDPAARSAFRERLKDSAGESVRLSRPELETRRLDAMTRAYRTNLNVLALVGLLTAAFLVYSLLTLSMRRRRPQFALLRVLGMERRRLAAWLLGEGVLLGVVGSAVGLALGLGLAWAGVQVLGGDLGAGYFSDVRARLSANALEMAVLGLLGTAAAVVGTLAPVLDNVRNAGEAALRRGGAEERDSPSTVVRLGVAAVALLGAGGLTQLPAWRGLPVAGYAAILLVLGAGLLLAPFALRLFARALPVSRRHVVALVARAQLLGAPRRSALAVSAALVSFALLVAMSTMIHSFRGSVTAWLDQILAAELYVRSGPGGQATYLPTEPVAEVDGWPGVRRVDTMRRFQLDWAPEGSGGGSTAPLQVTARDLGLDETRQAVTLLDGQWPEVGGRPEVLISEVMARRHDLEPGDALQVPLGGSSRRLTVAGVWRDYSYQWGHLLVDREMYRRVSGDERVDQMAVYLEEEAEKPAIRQRLESAFAGAPALEVADAGEIRRHSLDVFDRSFAVTYVLVVVAVGVGLIGTLQSLAVQALERRGELAMLRFLGFRIRDVARAQAYEGALVGGFGGLLGLAVGAVVAYLLVNVVNEQSFLWSLPVDFPAGLLAAAWAALTVAAGVGGWLLGRAQGAADPAQAVGSE